MKSLTKKLNPEMRQVYQKIFDDWEADGIVEKVPYEQLNDAGHYLPHKAVYKPSSLTTPVRPVFDASAKDNNSISLNKCLEKGPNLLEVITAIIIRFRMRRFGILADVKKAFLQISINPADRDYLRFLWWERDSEEIILVYRHKRLVFGLTCSSFVLGVTIKDILEHAPEQFQATAKQLQGANYVDNCVTSLDDEDSVQKFKTESVKLMLTGKFELRGWVSNSPSSNDTLDKEVSVLGLKWNLAEDTLSCDIDKGIKTDVPITKRIILSAAHQIFDPIGVTLPLLICPKLCLQECWEMKIGWDEELPLDISQKFRKWCEQLAEIKEFKIPRWIGCTTDNLVSCTLHTFTDASKSAYVACIFIRMETEIGVEVGLVQAKARMAPMKKLSIPRLELLGCLIGVRLANSVKIDMGLQNVKCIHWTDAADAIYWIKNEDCWGPFVSNRIKEIRESTDKNNWRHVPGKKNPADILTRTITAKQLAASRWWEGPSWLKKAEKVWPSELAVADEQILQSERKKNSICNWTVALTRTDSNWLSTCKFKNDYQKILRLTACILRFRKNSMKEVRIYGTYTANELNIAEKRIVVMIQREVFPENESELKGIELFIDDDDVLRVKTKLTLRNDDDYFISPAVLPGKHPIVRALIEYYHRKYSHAGTQTIMSILRERFWIVKCRVAVKKVVNDCTLCKRYRGKTFKTKPTYLPLERVRDAAIFEATGVDLAGPLNLRGTGKAWIVIYTCAVYRAIHLELVSSMSKESFIQSLRRFIARRGRPSSMWCDRGTNLVGTKNALNKLDWEKIIAAAAELKIEWNLNPPKAPWWGGWWEKLVGVVKSVLKRSLGKAYLHYEEMMTILCDIESVVNERPLTYLSEDSNELKHHRLF